jgi:hypothetical protein
MSGNKNKKDFFRRVKGTSKRKLNKRGQWSLMLQIVLWVLFTMLLLFIIIKLWNSMH